MDVAFWLDCRAFQHEPPLSEFQDFVVIESQLHDQFDLFKKSNVKDSYSWLPLCDLLTFYCNSKCPSHLNSKVQKFGKVYLELHTSDVDELVTWVDEMREKYFGIDGDKIFDNAALVIPTDKSSGIQL